MKKALNFLFLMMVLFLFSFWMAAEPNRRARNVYNELKSGMDLVQVENLLIGRNICFYQVNRTGNFESIPREEFLVLLENKNPNTSSQLRLWLTFLGSSPGRVSFFVEFEKGVVSKMTNPYGWD